MSAPNFPSWVEISDQDCGWGPESIVHVACEPETPVKVMVAYSEHEGGAVFFVDNTQDTPMTTAEATTLTEALTRTITMTASADLAPTIPAFDPCTPPAGWLDTTSVDAGVQTAAGPKDAHLIDGAIVSAAAVWDEKQGITFTVSGNACGEHEELGDLSPGQARQLVRSLAAVLAEVGQS